MAACGHFRVRRWAVLIGRERALSCPPVGIFSCPPTLVYSIRGRPVRCLPCAHVCRPGGRSTTCARLAVLYLTSSRTDHGAHPDPATDADNFAHAINADIRRQYERCNIDDGADPCALVALRSGTARRPDQHVRYQHISQPDNCERYLPTLGGHAYE